MKKLNNLLNVLIGTFLGVFLGRGLFQYFHYINHPEYYLFTSAPWYTGVLVQGILTAAVIILALIGKIVVKSRMKKQVQS